MRRLFRSRYEKKIAGICGGLALYTNSDPSVWRIIFLTLIFAPVPVIMFYFIAWAIIPKHNSL